MACTLCGACCVAPDIAALGKGLGVRCPNLGEDLLCTVYEDRPDVCRKYEADEICLLIDHETLDGRVEKYLALFGLSADRSPSSPCAQAMSTGSTVRA
jgi:Fe-S-cluster containining protein